MHLNRFLSIVFILGITLVFQSSSLALTTRTENQIVREPVRAGTFYPSDPDELRRMIKTFLNKVEKKKGKGRIIGGIVPHAGYLFSGQVAAHVYKQLEGLTIDTVILIGSCHNAYRVGLRGISVFPEGFYKTPLGPVQINSTIARSLLANGGPFRYLPAAHLDEHSLEVQLPFLQTIFENFTIVPVLLGTDSGLDTVLSDALTRLIDNDRTLVLVSTDMSHYPDYETACSVDSQMLDMVTTMDSRALFDLDRKILNQGLNNLHCTFCALQPVMALMNYTRNKAAFNVDLLNYANSGDISGADKNRVVGYCALIFTEIQPPNEVTSPPKTRTEADLSSESNSLTREVEIELLKIARQTLINHLKGTSIPKTRQTSPPYSEKRGVFVTLKIDHQLRGCIGHIIAQESLEQAVISNTINAASRDYRFMPVTAEELKSIQIEISVLTTPRLISSLDDFVVGQHGIILKKNRHQAVFLPQVATEQGWDKATTLSHLSRKAGLGPDAWQKDTDFYIFETQVFHE